jgi:hypothetical protein
VANQTLILVQTRVPKRLANRIKKEAKDKGLVSQAALVRQILTDYFAVKDALDAEKD